MGKCSWLMLDILYYLVSGLSYPSANFLTRIRTIGDSGFHRFCALVVSLSHTGGAATFGICRKQ